tara:strand:- start:72 stop:686 length:615 start_codon:yes stop_codon:yes gene_type:complete
MDKKKEEKKEEPKLKITLEQGEKDLTKLTKCVKLMLSDEGKLALGQSLTNSIKAMETRLPEMWREYDVAVKDMKSILSSLSLSKEMKVTDSVNKNTKYYVKRNGEIICEYDDAVYNSVMACEVAKQMHSVDLNSYYSASVEVTFSPVLIEGGSKEPQEIGLWSSDSVTTDDEFDFEGIKDKTHLLGAVDIFGNGVCSKECWCND